MHSLRLLQRRRIAPPHLCSAPRTPGRPFTAGSRWRLKEDKERSPEEAERVKEEQRRKAEAGQGEWHESLASQSESHVGADREHVRDHDAHMSELQRETADETQKKHPEAK